MVGSTNGIGNFRGDHSSQARKNTKKGKKGEGPGFTEHIITDQLNINHNDVQNTAASNCTSYEAVLGIGCIH